MCHTVRQGGAVWSDMSFEKYYNEHAKVPRCIIGIDITRQKEPLEISWSNTFNIFNEDNIQSFDNPFSTEFGCRNIYSNGCWKKFCQERKMWMLNESIDWHWNTYPKYLK